MKGNSNKQPDPIQKIGDQYQIRWNIVRNDRINIDETTVESWDYEYANCQGDSYANVKDAVIRSRYSADQAEAIFANYLDGIHIPEYLAFQQYRTLAKAVAGGKSLKSELDLIVATNNDRISDLEVSTTAVIEVLTEKGITP